MATQPPATYAGTVSTGIQREADDIEQRKVALMDSAKVFTDAAALNAQKGQYVNPDYSVAGMSPDQLIALQMGRTGIGAYQPFLNTATSQAATAAGMGTQAAAILAAADTRNQFIGAGGALNRAVDANKLMGQSATLAGQGVPLIGEGATGLRGASADIANKYSSADLTESQKFMRDSMGAMNLAQPEYTSTRTRLNEGLTDFEKAAIGAQNAANQPGFAQGIGSLQAGAAQGEGATQQAGFGEGVGAAFLAAEQAKLAAAQPGFNQATSTLQQGIGALGGGAQRFDPSSAQGFMNPFQQQVIDESIRQINRQGDISRQNLQAQATRAGAFGGSREGVQRAELERAISEQRNAAITGALASGYGSAQQQAQQAFEQQQQRQLAQAQGYQGAAGTQASIAGQQAGLGQSAAQQLAQAAQLQTNVAGQQAGLGLQAAGLTQNVGQGQLSAAGTQGQLGLSAAQQRAAAGAAGLQASQQLAAIEAQKAQFAQNAAQYTGNIGQALGQQQFQQTQLGQNAASLRGNMANQLAGLSDMYSNIAGKQAGILGQQSQLEQSVAQNVGNLADQQFNIAAKQAQGLGSLGAQQGNIAMQTAALGQQSQAQGQQDSNFLYNLGMAQQKQLQSEKDVARQNIVQKNMQPYQQIAFLSDIYRGAPSSQMSSMQQAAPTPSPFQQVAGLGIAGLSAAGAASRAGII